MTMHLLPAIGLLTITKNVRRKLYLRKNNFNIRTREVSQKMGVDPNYKKKGSPLKTERTSVKLPEKKITDYDWKIQTKRDAMKYHGNVVIGQAYNKGNLVVLSSKEQSDAAITGKRR